MATSITPSDSSDNSNKKLFEEMIGLLEKNVKASEKSSKNLDKVEKILRDNKKESDRRKKEITTANKIAESSGIQTFNNETKKLPPPTSRLPIPREKAESANWEVIDDKEPVGARGKSALPGPGGGGGGIPALPGPPGASGSNRGRMMGGLGGAVAARAPIAIGAMAADTALGMMGVGDNKVTGYMEAQDEENWKKMSFLQKARSGFARGVEKVGGIIGMDNVSKEARYQRIQNESGYFKRKEEEGAQEGVDAEVSKPQMGKGLAQVLDEQDAERKKKQKEASEVGPSRVTKENYQAAQNQAADYKSAGETMATAGYSKAPSSSSSSVTSRKTYQEIYEEELKLQKGFGTEEQQKSRAAQTARLRYRAQQENEGYQQSQVSQVSSAKPGAKEMQPDDFEQAQQAQAAREAVGRGLRQRTRSKPPTTSEPTIFDKIQSKISNVKNEIGFAYNRGTGETPGEQELDKKMEEIVSAREKEGNPLERFGEEYEDIRKKLRKEIEAKDPKAFMQAEQKIGSQSQLSKSSKQNEDGYSNQTEFNRSVTSSKSLFGSEFLGGLFTKKGLSKEFSIGNSSQSTEKNGELSNVMSDVTARRESGGFFGRDKYKVTLDGEDIDVDKQYYGQIKSLLDAGKPKEAASMARYIRDQKPSDTLKSPEETVTPMSQGASSLPEVLTGLSSENRDLSRESSSGQVQPIIVNNNNSTSSQSFVPIQAQPRLQSSFNRYQERTASY